MAAVTDAEAAEFRETGVLLKPRFFSAEEARAMKAAVEELRSAGHMTDIHFNDEHVNLQMPWMSHHQRLFQLIRPPRWRLHRSGVLRSRGQCRSRRP